MGQVRRLTRASTPREQDRCTASQPPPLKPTATRPRQCQRLTCVWRGAQLPPLTGRLVAPSRAGVFGYDRWGQFGSSDPPQRPRPPLRTRRAPAVPPPNSPLFAGGAGQGGVEGRVAACRGGRRPQGVAGHAGCLPSPSLLGSQSGWWGALCCVRGRGVRGRRAHGGRGGGLSLVDRTLGVCYQCSLTIFVSGRRR